MNPVFLEWPVTTATHAMVPAAHYYHLTTVIMISTVALVVGVMGAAMILEHYHKPVLAKERAT